MCGFSNGEKLAKKGRKTCREMDPLREAGEFLVLNDFASFQKNNDDCILFIPSFNLKTDIFWWLTRQKIKTAVISQNSCYVWSVEVKWLVYRYIPSCIVIRFGKITLASHIVYDDCGKSK